VGLVADAAPSVRFARLESRGLLLGLSGGQLGFAGAGLIVVVLAQYGGGTAAALAAAPVWAPLLALGLVSVRGRPLVGWLPVAGGWLTRRVSGAATQRTPIRVTSGLVIPGTSRLTLTSTAAGAGVVRDGTDSSSTTVLRLDGSGLVLADGSDQARLVDGWSSVLAVLGQSPSIVRVQLLQRGVPGGSAPLRSWWAQRAAGTRWASVVTELLGTGEDTLRPESLLAVRWATPRAARRGALDGSLDERLTAFTASVQAAGVRVRGWASPEELLGLLRTAFDPGCVASRDEHPGTTGAPVAGMGLDEAWAQVRTDSALHAIYWVAEWPRADTHVAFLQPLLTGATRRTLSVVVEPVPLGRALRDVRRAKVEHAADEARNLRWGRVADESARAESDDVARRERDLVAGHADLRFVGLLTVTADDQTGLDAACAATETAAAHAASRPRRVTGQQAAGFLAGAVPLARGAT
jgi:hypothetical protein